MMAMRTLAFAALVAVGTWFLGWWSVPLCGVGYALLRAGQGGIVVEASLGAMLAWGALLAWQLSNPAFSRLQEAISGVFPVPVAVLMLVTLMFAGILAGAAARLTAGD
jgi:hypothetical protein